MKVFRTGNCTKISRLFYLLLWALVLHEGSGEEEGGSRDRIERFEKINEDFSVAWVVDLTEKNVTFTVTARTTGFVGFGISPTGGEARNVKFQTPHVFPSFFMGGEFFYEKSKIVL